MPPKYQIHAAPVPNRFPTVTRSGVIAWEEGCLRCARCVKRDCVYQVYDRRDLETGQMTDSLDTACKDCFRCVQNCPGRLIHKGLNPRFKALGDDYWTPEIISRLWYQAETGRIPVSGAGYGGPFSGPGFDAMWTDMSEIVRPTRDGIHGREYISTQVDLGRKPMALALDAQGNPSPVFDPLVEIPIPVILDCLPWPPSQEGLDLARLKAARALGTLAVVPQERWGSALEPLAAHAVPLLGAGSEPPGPQLVRRLRMAELEDGPEVLEARDRLKAVHPDLVVAIRLPLGPGAAGRVLALARRGAEVLHLLADSSGREQGGAPRFIKECVKEIHVHLLEAGLRDQVTLLAGGGIAMAEHMAKVIICGVDAVSVDIPLLVAMECRVCGRCTDGLACPVELEQVTPGWGAARVRNLMAGWHSQLLEVMGAMGLREVRRLRGEMGRAMFFEELERDFFASLGRRI